MGRHIATAAGATLAAIFVAVSFVGRADSQRLSEVAPRAGMSGDELLALGPRVAAQTGVTLGTSRHVVYLLACSGRATRQSLEQQATLASAMALRQRLSDHEAVRAVLGLPVVPAVPETDTGLRGC